MPYMSYDEYVKRYPRKLALVRANGKIWVQSQFTGEIVRPYDIAGIYRMVRDMFTRW